MCQQKDILENFHQKVEKAKAKLKVQSKLDENIALFYGI
jgi:hypothetical protein